MFGHRSPHGETLTPLENTLQIGSKHLASRCEDFTLGKYSGHSRKHSFYLLPFFPAGSQTWLPHLPSLQPEPFPMQLASPLGAKVRDGQGRAAGQQEVGFSVQGIQGASWPFFSSHCVPVSGCGLPR